MEVPGVVSKARLCADRSVRATHGAWSWSLAMSRRWSLFGHSGPKRWASACHGYAIFEIPREDASAGLEVSCRAGLGQAGEGACLHASYHADSDGLGEDL